MSIYKKSIYIVDYLKTFVKILTKIKLNFINSNSYI